MPPQIIFEPFALLIKQNKHKSSLWNSVLETLADARCHFVFLQFLLACCLLITELLSMWSVWAIQIYTVVLFNVYLLTSRRLNSEDNNCFPRIVPKSWYSLEDPVCCASSVPALMYLLLQMRLRDICKQQQLHWAVCFLDPLNSLVSLWHAWRKILIQAVWF